MQLSSSLDPGIKEELYFSRSTNGVSLNMSSEDAFEKVLLFFFQFGNNLTPLTGTEEKCYNIRF